MSKRKPKSRHHRKPRSLKGSNEPRNISLVPREHHCAWHTLFQNMTPDEICKLINSVWLDPDYYFVCRKKNEDYKRSQLELWGDY